MTYSLTGMTRIVERAMYNYLNDTVLVDRTDITVYSAQAGLTKDITLPAVSVGASDKNRSDTGLDGKHAENLYSIDISVMAKTDGDRDTIAGIIHREIIENSGAIPVYDYYGNPNNIYGYLDLDESSIVMFPISDLFSNSPARHHQMEIRFRVVLYKDTS